MLGGCGCCTTRPCRRRSRSRPRHGWPRVAVHQLDLQGRPEVLHQRVVEAVPCGPCGGKNSPGSALTQTERMTLTFALRPAGGNGVPRTGIARHLRLDTHTVRRFADATCVQDLLVNTGCRDSIIDAFSPICTSVGTRAAPTRPCSTKRSAGSASPEATRPCVGTCARSAPPTRLRHHHAQAHRHPRPSTMDQAGTDQRPEPVCAPSPRASNATSPQSPPDSAAPTTPARRRTRQPHQVDQTPDVRPCQLSKDQAIPIEQWWHPLHYCAWRRSRAVCPG